MARYIAQSTHTPEECLQALDTFLAHGEGTLASWDFGCATGDHSNHTAYAVLEASSEASARGQVPPSLQAATRLAEVGKFTPAQIRSFHAG
jgi:hypothetical protein